MIFDVSPWNRHISTARSTSHGSLDTTLRPSYWDWWIAATRWELPTYIRSKVLPGNNDGNPGVFGFLGYCMHIPLEMCNIWRIGSAGVRKAQLQVAHKHYIVETLTDFHLVSSSQCMFTWWQYQRVDSGDVDWLQNMMCRVLIQKSGGNMGSLLAEVIPPAFSQVRAVSARWATAGATGG